MKLKATMEIDADDEEAKGMACDELADLVLEAFMDGARAAGNCLFGGAEIVGLEKR